MSHSVVRDGEDLAQWRPDLSSEEELKLLELWRQVFNLFDKHAEAEGNKPVHLRQVSKWDTAGSESSRRKRSSGRSRGTANDHNYVGVNPAAKTVESPFPGMSYEEVRRIFWALFKHDHPDHLLLRFLRHQKWDVAKAHGMMVKSGKWRHETRLEEDIMFNGEQGALDVLKDSNEKYARERAEGFLLQFRKGKNFVRGVDREGRPIVYIRSRLHRSSEQPVESIERSIVYTFETTRLFMNPPIASALLIFDLTNFGIANMDFFPIKFMIGLFENYYPEAFDHVIIHRAPWIFQGFWKVIRGWISAEANQHIHFTNNVSDLEKFIPRQNILKELGGDDDWEYVYEEARPGENEQLAWTDERNHLLKERMEVIDKVEQLTCEWARGVEDGRDVKEIRDRRDVHIKELRANYWKLDPMLRARSLYDRWGVIQADGRVVTPVLASRKDQVTMQSKGLRS
ncbi:hypothetical protein B0A49_12972 [Cryomyces minteri]|uniref:CRAL-TRIO domain-containing protein n=1 Tax=Cryomyces minteri TaxID=331657 RepID=A0A4U0WUI2_9PEZI|nr:hypothetical protein B0A49_12972 [Cryomyces minteri]